MPKLLIVEDSALMRRHLRAVFERAGGFELAFARNGREAVVLNREFEPDVVTLDVHMPEMDGLTALAFMLAERPVPVVMVSSVTEAGALATLEALNLGAVDFVTKPDGSISHSVVAIEQELVLKVRTALRARIPQRPVARAGQRTGSARSLAPGGTGETAEGLVLIGVSTGGPRTLEDILPRLPPDFPWAVIVAQHMPPVFTRAFAQRMDSVCALPVQEVDRPLPLRGGTIYVGRGGTDVAVSARPSGWIVLAQPPHTGYPWHPSVNHLARSVLKEWDPERVVAVLLTGMGDDGAEGFAELYRRGAHTVAESDASAVVFGMPDALIRRGAASTVLPAPQIADYVVHWIRRRSRRLGEADRRSSRFAHR